jgi:hypothetical protein
MIASHLPLPPLSCGLRTHDGMEFHSLSRLEKVR